MLRIPSSPDVRFSFSSPLAAQSARADEQKAILPPPAERTIDFAADIQPLLQKNCFSCHGAEHQEGGLRLDQKKRALEGGDSGAEIVPGKSAESRLVRMIAGIDEDFGQMPPDGKGKPLDRRGDRPGPGLDRSRRQVAR